MPCCIFLANIPTVDVLGFLSVIFLKLGIVLEQLWRPPTCTECPQYQWNAFFFTSRRRQYCKPRASNRKTLQEQCPRYPNQMISQPEATENYSPVSWIHWTPTDLWYSSGLYTRALTFPIVVSHKFALCYLLYANDTALYASGNDPVLIQQALQVDLYVIWSWLITNAVLDQSSL